MCIRDRGDYFPALVAMAQIPVVGWLKRHLTPKECARIQSFDVDGIFGKPFVLGEQDNQSYKQLGNAVNVNMILQIQRKLDLFLDNPSAFPKLEPVQFSLNKF